MKSFTYKDPAVIGQKDGKTTVNGFTKDELLEYMEHLPDTDSYLYRPSDISRISYTVFELNYIHNAIEWIELEENIFAMAEELREFSNSKKRTMSLYANSWDQVKFKVKKIKGGEVEINTIYEGPIGKKMEAAGVTERSTWNANQLNMVMFANWVRYAHYICKQNADMLRQ